MSSPPDNDVGFTTVGQKPKRKLLVYNRYFKSVVPNLQFEIISHFKIDPEQNLCITNKLDIPHFIPESEITDEEFTKAFKELKIVPAQDNIQNKDIIFDWFAKFEYFKKVRENKCKKPDFVSFGRQIRDPMLTPWLKKYSWEIYATKWQDIIFLWRKNESTKQDSKVLSEEEKSFGFFYEAWKTGKLGNNLANFDINKLEHHYIAQDVTFGEHQLLLVNEVDAQDNENKLVEIKTYKESKSSNCNQTPIKAASKFNPKNKYLTFWGQCNVSGVDKLVVGRRDENGILSESGTFTMNQVLNEYHPFNTTECYCFENRLLEFIKRQFVENNPKLVLKFSYTGNQKPSVGKGGSFELIPDKDLKVVCSKVDVDLEYVGRFYKKLLEIYAPVG